jgi:hypothetical protein
MFARGVGRTEYDDAVQHGMRSGDLSTSLSAVDGYINYFERVAAARVGATMPAFPDPPVQPTGLTPPPPPHQRSSSPSSARRRVSGAEQALRWLCKPPPHASAAQATSCSANRLGGPPSAFRNARGRLRLPWEPPRSVATQTLVSLATDLSLARRAPGVPAGSGLFVERMDHARKRLQNPHRSIAPPPVLN